MRKPPSSGAGRALATAAILGALAAACGCSAPGGPPAPATTSHEFNAVWDASLEVLRENRFEIDRQDRRSGTITTFPLLGRQWFEFWRTDAFDRRNVAESTLHTLYRQVTVTIRPVEKSGEDRTYAADVAVRTSRSALPNVRVTNTSEAYELFFEPPHMAHRRTVALPDTGLERPAPVKPVDLGRDEDLGGLLGLQIANRAAQKRAAAKAP